VTRRTGTTRKRPLPVSVIIPTRNAAHWIVACVAAIRESRPGQVILVDGHSDDGTVLLAEPLVDRVIRDDGRGPGPARNLGVEAAHYAWVAFIDADVVLPPDGLKRLFQEARQRELDGLQAALHSSGSDYWSEQLAWHHNHGRSRGWFGVSATVMRTATAREHPFDPDLTSGEDIDLRLRLADAGVPVGVSEDVIVEHVFAPTLGAARAQWSADGAGLGRLVRRRGSGAIRHLLVPFLAGLYWIARSLIAPRRLPYFLGFVVGNWRGALRGLADADVPFGTDDARRAVGVATAILWIGGIGLAVAAGIVVVIVASLIEPVRELLQEAIWLPVLAAIAVVGLIGLEIVETLPEGHGLRTRVARYRPAIFVFVLVTVLATVLRLVADLRLIH